MTCARAAGRTLAAAVLATCCGAPAESPAQAARPVEKRASEPALPASTAPVVRPAAALVQKQLPAAVTEASAIAALPDGRFLIAGDDERRPLTVVDLLGARAPVRITQADVKHALKGTGVTALNDLEGLTRDGRNRIYAVTSHAPTNAGVRKPDREILLRFTLEDDGLAEVRVCRQLRAALAAIDPVFGDAEASTRKDEDDLNIEALAWDPAHSRLLIAFRSPRRHRQALAVWLENPDAVFDQHAAPALSVPIGFALEGGGIRDATYAPSLGAFVLVAGASRAHQHAAPGLWLWKGGSDAPERVDVAGLEGLNPEGVVEAQTPDGTALIVVSDDGAVKPNRYVVIPIAALRR